MAVTTALPTITVFRKSDNAKCVINEVDFDETLYSLEDKKEEVKENPLRRGRKTTSQKGE